MAALKDMAFDYSMQRGVGKKAYENYMAAKIYGKQIYEHDKM